MKINTQAYAKGYRAFQAGIFRTSNPYLPWEQGIAWNEWFMGWDCAENDELKGKQ